MVSRYRGSDVKSTRTHVCVLIAGALAIPAALRLIVHLFPKPDEQARAIAIISGMAALGYGKYLMSV